MSPMSAESTVVRNYLDWLLGIPWKVPSKVKYDLNDALASLNRGIMYPFYVIEVEVEGWDGNDPRNKELLSHVSI